ncbi:NAC-alpha domain-containing protein 1 [Cucumis melo var. makuwa]|uniref:NAC-alpha domain-containing protein 1 n=2 Tax=Cucumis melo var. makuwa TaxID=1194695 RepID=A0A5A7TNI6_CUCMM|nr:NAC-alpha domain-containing protein 1 [Cucumis melo var. makuwa]
MALLFSLEGSTELTLEFSGLAVGLVGDSFLSLVTVQYVVKHWSGCRSWSLDGEGHTRLMRASFGSTRLICASFGSTRLMCASFGSTRLICASFGSTRLMCASFGSTRLICASLGSTRLICAFYGTTRLLCKGTARGRPTRGRKDA